MSARQKARLRPVKLGALPAEIERRPDGTIYMRCARPLSDFPKSWLDPLAYWAKKTPDRVFIAGRDTDGEWRKLTYAQVHEKVRRIAASLLTRKLSKDQPIAILSGNDIEHALLAMAAIYAGIPYAPVSPAYSLVSSDFGRLRYILDLLTPGMIFINDAAPFARAIEVLPQGAELVVGRNAPAGRQTTAFADLDSGDVAAADAAHKKVKPDDIVKILFTSGSTGQPKGVINTHRMLSANQAQARAGFAFAGDEPPTIVDWLPWSHTFGSNHNFGFVLHNGGTLYIDDGNPTPPGVPKTVRNLREVAPDIYFNVPKGYEMLLPHLRADETLRKNFFSRLKVLFYAGAGLNNECWHELEKMSVEATGERVIFLTSIGSTETSPLALACTWDFDRPGNIGVPAPGVELKLVPNEGKLESRLRGPNITPGYWRQDALTRDAFDDEGFYKIGDALKFADPNHPDKGLLFDGRIAEDYKLSTGTWVSVGPLRAQFIDYFAPLVRDAVLAGTNRDDIAVLVFPDMAACQKLCPDLPADAGAARVLGDARVRDEFEKRLKALAGKSAGSSTRVGRALLLEEPPSMDKGEMTDKGSINQRAVLKNRAALVDELYAAPLSSRVISIGSA